AAAAPTNANSIRVTIESAHTITATSAVTAVDLVVDGTFQMGAGGSIAASGITFNATGVYDHNRDGGVIPNAIWDASSTCLISGVIATAPTGFAGQTFGNFDWNSTGQTSASLSLALTSTTTRFNGDFTVTSTGASSTNILSLASAAATVLMNGKLIINGGTFILNTAASITNLTVAGDLELNAGTFNITSSTSAQVFNLGGTYNQVGGVFTNTGAGLSVVTFTGVAKNYIQTGGTVTSTNINYVIAAAASLTIDNSLTIATSRTFVVTLGGTLNLNNGLVINGTLTNNGALYCGANLITGTGTFTQTSAITSTLGIGHADGINLVATGLVGNIRTSVRTFGVNANFIYNGSVAQSTGTGLPATYGIANAFITIDNSNGVSLTQALSINNIANTGLNVLNGSILLGNFNLTIPASASLNITPSVSSMIITNGTGLLIRGLPVVTAPATYSILFPLGEQTGVTEYSPVTLNFTSNATATNIGLRVVDAREPNDALSTDYLTRHWVLTNATATATYALTANFTYVAADVVNTESNLELNQFNTSTLVWTEYNSTVSSPVLSASLTNTNAFLPAAGVTVNYTGRVNAPLYYQSTGSSNWNNVATWEVSTDPTFVSPAPVPATVVPNNLNSDGITIQTGHTVSVTAAQTADDLIVNGTLSVNAVTFTLANGVAAFDMVVNGTLMNNGVGSVITPTGAIQVASTGTYQHAMNAGTVPTATWVSGSTCLITGVTLNQPGGLAQAFHHVTWNSTGQSTTVNMTITSSVNWGGNFTIISTGTTPQQLRLTNSTITLGIGGNLDIQ
ncbi:MAG TPA: hypothetical protein PL185_05390, partial [Flavobacteriales bacterium]|nr:hypothetical protein [Flavobacteriales bacterium]